MAILLLDNGISESNLSKIVDELESLNIKLRNYETGTSLLFSKLLEQEAITESEKRYIVELHNNVFEFLQTETDYDWSDLLNIHAGSPNLENWIATYARYHTHNAAEAIYLLAGEIIYGFVRPDGTQVQLLLQHEDYLYIPNNVEHLCNPSGSLHFKLIRYFTTVKGWIPNYTATHHKFKI
jgi:1,2-dihydroxy-3-keto-5-methylthiopentene dioxygenase